MPSMVAIFRERREARRTVRKEMKTMAMMSSLVQLPVTTAVAISRERLEARGTGIKEKFEQINYLILRI